MTSIEDDRKVLESDRANDCQGQEKSSSHSTSPWKVDALRFTHRPGLSQQGEIRKQKKIRFLETDVD
jgi:hypothetical protein